MPWSKMVDMELDDEDTLDQAPTMSSDKRPSYPWGLRICLTDKELEKLGIDRPENVGDIIDLRAFACVTSISENKNADGSECCRVELQIEKLAIESEMDEGD
jgi:hypothetical protein